MTERQRIVVHLGNVGGGVTWMQKMMQMAQQHSDTQFIGIDQLMAPRAVVLANNWTQIRAEFLSGLASLEDSYAHEIISEIAAGHSSEQELPNLLRLCYDKLRPGGKLSITVAKRPSEFVQKAFEKSDFSRITARRVPAGQLGETFWKDYYLKKNLPLYQFTATKPREGSR